MEPTSSVAQSSFQLATHQPTFDTGAPVPQPGPQSPVVLSGAAEPTAGPPPEQITQSGAPDTAGRQPRDIVHRALTFRQSQGYFGKESQDGLQGAVITIGIHTCFFIASRNPTLLSKKDKARSALKVEILSDLSDDDFEPNGGVEDYSDVDVDVTSAAAKMAKEEREREKERNSPGWKPGFLKKHEHGAQRSVSLKGKEQERELEDGLSRLTPPTLNSLPVTPPPIRAYDRITRARPKSMASSSPATPSANSGTPSMFQTLQIDSSATISADTSSLTLAINDDF
ncbi:hypothetical protein M407DRAFT_19476 [Tulasnella calospora MUT 4182]|uniref:Uncharacterized protein n=1 Tax=Tulasnella calospora MUT 4182 TaxID=1051891 RepID=A0A0C3MCP3_9AGAM|nr:hypothetical protein M407DRAFT_19476 [Tulasnella calospora MUT 4182]